MEAKKAYKLINEILRENNTETGIFISLLSHEYISMIDMPRKDFIKRLSNSLEMLEKQNTIVQKIDKAMQK